MKTRNDENIELINQKNFEQLLINNIRYINHFAFKYNLIKSDELYNELVQAGKVGLYFAYLNFDIDANATFMYYASFWIKKEMMNVLDYNTNTIKINQHQKKQIENGEIPIITTISTSTSSTLSDEDNTTVGDMLSSPDDDIKFELVGEYDFLYKQINQLSTKQQQIITMYFGLNETKQYTQQEIGDKLNITRQAVNDQIKVILKKLKKKIIKN